MPGTALSRWVPFEDRDEHGFDDEPVVSCFLGKIFHFWQGRNAWRGRWSGTYLLYESFWPDLEATKEQIEQRRVRGSQWSIKELPMVVFSGEKQSVAVFSLDTSEPLKSWTPIRKKLLRITEFGDYFQPDKQNSVFRLITPAGAVSPAALPFRDYRSCSRGGGYSLSWSESVSKDNLQFMLKIVSRVNKSIQSEARRRESPIRKVRTAIRL